MLEDVMASVQQVFGSADAVSLIIMLVVVLAAGLALSGVGNIVNVTVGALVFYGLGRLALLASQGVPLGELPGRGWDSLKTMQVNELAVYFIAFAVIILLVHIVRGATSSNH
jgi:hypothetical protein